MKQSELQVGYVYGNGGNKYRVIDTIEFSEDRGQWEVHYHQVGSQPIRGKMYRLPYGKRFCQTKSFAQWALYGFSEDTFLATRQNAEVS